MGNKIYHSGIIKNIEDKSVEVEIVASSACSSCESKSLCRVSEQERKLIRVSVLDSKSYEIGQTVNIAMEDQIGLTAVFWAYIAPFLVCIATLFGLSVILKHELVLGIGTLMAVALYFAGLKIFSKKLTRTLSWYLE